jgi:hypothetical protein
VEARVKLDARREGGDPMNLVGVAVLFAALTLTAGLLFVYDRL